MLTATNSLQCKDYIIPSLLAFLFLNKFEKETSNFENTRFTFISPFSSFFEAWGSRNYMEKPRFVTILPVYFTYIIFGTLLGLICFFIYGSFEVTKIQLIICTLHAAIYISMKLIGRYISQNIENGKTTKESVSKGFIPWTIKRSLLIFYHETTFNDLLDLAIDWYISAKYTRHLFPNAYSVISYSLSFIQIFAISDYIFTPFRMIKTIDNSENYCKKTTTKDQEIEFETEKGTICGKYDGFKYVDHLRDVPVFNFVETNGDQRKEFSFIYTYSVQKEVEDKVFHQTCKYVLSELESLRHQFVLYLIFDPQILFDLKK